MLQRTGLKTDTLYEFVFWHSKQYQVSAVCKRLVSEQILIQKLQYVLRQIVFSLNLKSLFMKLMNKEPSCFL